jgi:hypothetical protein
MRNAAGSWEGSVVLWCNAQLGDRMYKSAGCSLTPSGNGEACGGKGGIRCIMPQGATELNPEVMKLVRGSWGKGGVIYYGARVQPERSDVLCTV